MNDYEEEYRRRTLGHRPPTQVYADMCEVWDREPAEPVDLIKEFVRSMSAYGMVLYQP